MKMIIFLSILCLSVYAAAAQTCPSTCAKTSCGPGGTKEEEAAVIGSMRTELQSVITRMSKSSLAFDNRLKAMTIEKGASDDESLLYIAQAATSIRYELLDKIESSKLVASLREYRPSGASTKQQMVSNLKKEIQILTSQAEKLQP